MGDFNWEYEAPKFVDFEADEHLSENADEYFDRLRESNCFPTDTLQHDEAAEEQKTAKPLIPPNLMTPSRIATWQGHKVNYHAGKHTTEKSKSKPPLRRSLRRSNPVATLSATPGTSSAPPSKKAKKETAPKTLTTPSTRVVPHNSTQQRHLTTEERQLEEIKKLRLASKKSREEGKKLVKKLERQTRMNLSGKSHTTKVQEFHFKTDERRALKLHNMSTRADTSLQPSEFKAALRKYEPSPAKKSRTTVVEPFRWAKRKRTPTAEQPRAVPFVPMAKAIMDFQSRTPVRFKKSSNAEHREVKPLRSTIPKTPNITKPKPRSKNVISQAEKEELELEQIKKHQFKAKPVNCAVLQAPQPIAVEKKPATVPVEFHLSANVPHTNPEPTTIKPAPFKAQPVPAFVLEKPAEQKKRSIEVTVPMSPAFSLKNRIKPKVVGQEPDLQPQKFFRPPPDASKFFKPKIQSKATEPEPFSFDVKDKERLAKKEEKIKEVLQKETASASFKAQPMPIPLSPSETLPVKQLKPSTKSEPFQLRCDERAASRVDRWAKQVEDEVKEMREQAEFKATKNYEKVLSGKPWQPKLEHKSMTEPLNVVLRSDARAKEREELQKRRLEEIKEKENLRKEQEIQQEELKKKELKEFRRSLVHKAQDIHKYKGVNLKQSSKPLTIAESPKFSTRFNK